MVESTVVAGAMRSRLGSKWDEKNILIRRDSMELILQ